MAAAEKLTSAAAEKDRDDQEDTELYLVPDELIGY